MTDSQPQFELPPQPVLGFLNPLLVSFGVTCLGYGCFLTLTIVTLFTMLRNGLPTSRGRQVLLAAVLLFFVFSTIFCISSWLMYSRYVLYYPISLELIGRTQMVMNVAAISGYTIFVFNDVIVVWRAWAVAQQRVLRGILALLLGAMIVCIVTDVVIVFSEGQFTVLFLPLEGPPAEPSFVLIIYIPLLLTNFISTVIILYKTWVYRKQVKAHLQSDRTRKTQVERVLFLLIESGFMYCAVWIIFLFSFFYGTILVYIMESIMPFIAAVYPLIIILVVEHQKSSQYSATESPTRPGPIQFASPPISSCLQDWSGRGNISILQSIVEHIELETCRETRDCEETS